MNAIDAAILAALRIMVRRGPLTKRHLISRLRANDAHSVPVVSDALGLARDRKLIMIVDNYSTVAVTQAGRDLLARHEALAPAGEAPASRISTGKGVRRSDEELTIRRQAALTAERDRRGLPAPSSRTCDHCDAPIGTRGPGEAHECGLCQYRRAQAS